MRMQRNLWACCVVMGLSACGTSSSPSPTTTGSGSGPNGSGNGVGSGAAGNGRPGTSAPPAGSAGGMTGPVDAGTSGGGGTVSGSVVDSGTENAEAGDSAVGGGSITHCAATQPLPPITDYTQAGPFQTTVEGNVGPNNNYTIYRPNPLGANGFLHPPIIFGPGIATSCAPLGGLNVYTTLLTHLASHGFVTICVNSLSGAPGDPANLDAMKQGLDWLVAQNAQAGSTYEGKLAVSCAVGSGYSIGATASTDLSSHPAVMTTVSIHGHKTTGQPHGPIWLMTGTMDVIDDNRTTLSTLTTAPAVLTALPIGHLNVPTEIAPGGRYIAPITAWLRYWVYGDQGAKDFFFGANCKVCTNPWITPETNDLWKALPP